MNVYTAEGTQSFFVSSGSYTVNNDSTVSIIAEEACKLSDLDKEAATKALAAAQVNDFKVFKATVTDRIEMAIYGS